MAKEEKKTTEERSKEEQSKEICWERIVEKKLKQR